MVRARHDQPGVTPTWLDQSPVDSPMANYVHNLHHTLDTLNHILIYSRVTPKPERGYPIPNCCPMRQEIRQRAPVTTTQNGLGDYDVVQTA